MSGRATGAPLSEVASTFGTGNSDPDVAPLHAEESRDALYVHPEARTLFNKFPCLRYVPLFGTATEGYGPKAVLSLAMSYFLCKGLADYFVRQSLYAMFTRRFGVDGMTYQRLANVGGMGWSIKPLTAVVSDMFPFFGYSKRWYMFVSCIVGSAVSLGFGLLPPVSGSAQLGAGLVFVTCFTKANVDILLEGHYSRMMRRLPGPGPALVSWIWWFVIAGSLVSVSVVGPLGDAGYPQIASFLATGLQLLTCVFFIFNWVGELPNRVERLEDARVLYEENLKEQAASAEVVAKTVSENGSDGDAEPYSLDDAVMVGYDTSTYHDVPENALLPFEFVEPRSCCCGVFEINDEVRRRNLRVTVYSLLMVCCVISVAAVSIAGTRDQLLYTAIAVSVAHCCCNFYALPLIVAKANLFGYLQKASALQFPGSITSFYTAQPDCVPDGPHFNLFFYQTVGGLIGNFASIVGIVMFNYVFSKRTYRMTFVVTVLLGIVASFFDLIIVMRWNSPRVSDHAVYILGDAIVSEVITMLNWMPMIVLLSQLCPRGSESTVYAILAASANLGQSMASIIGSLIMEYKLPVATEVPCDFSNLRWHIIIGGFLAPLVQIPLTFLLIPSARMCDRLQIDGTSVKREKDTPMEPISAEDEPQTTAGEANDKREE
ncbi:pteridine transporter [Trypanosoma grayi]|uniref:pteridine transporter n=1 Tax=Trypanosoma grayi TaxID=71804 RepID=UPI0004F3EF90|nr:pteridine transporter [Trypanosoma grayi]KEG15230.1 pteridine transporter [Trypanosoma grayi]